jgi:hypothetical protein
VTPLAQPVTPTLPPVMTIVQLQGDNSCGTSTFTGKCISTMPRPTYAFKLTYTQVIQCRDYALR